MLKYILRLDDACETMNFEKWTKMESLLDKYHIKPIVGIIPDNKDKDFNNAIITNFWEICYHWQKKGWVIAQHGLNHQYISEKYKSEFSTKSYQEQKRILNEGYQILLSHHINVSCFFAPNHTFDNNTIKAIKDLAIYKFVSDGCSLYPFTKHGVLFLPSIFDTPHKILNRGIYTFIYHPNNMKEEDFIYLEKFLEQNYEKFDVSIDDVINCYSNRKRTIIDYFIQIAIYLYRKLRTINERKK